MREPIGIAFAGDWHGNQWWAKDALLSINLHGADTVLHAGDYGYDFDDEFVSTVEAACAIDDMHVYFIDGNHDDHSRLFGLPLDDDGFGILSPHVRYIPRGHRWQWWGKTFLGVGGAVSVDKRMRREGTSWWPTETLTDHDIAQAIEGGPVDVMLTHDCPSRVPIPGITPGNNNGWPADLIAESHQHRRRLDTIVEQVQPELLIHGHYHRRYVGRVGDMKVVGLHCDGSTWSKNIWVAWDAEDLERGPFA